MVETKTLLEKQKGWDWYNFVLKIYHISFLLLTKTLTKYEEKP